MWKNAPDPSGIEQHLPASPPVLEDDKIVNMPDITFKDDLLELEDLANTRGLQPDTHPDNKIRPDHLCVTVKDAKDREIESQSTYYIEDFPANLGVGAVWGEDMPFFEKLWREQERNGLSRWGPFEDQDEWELAKWLIRNVGQKQINSFLNLNIVHSHHFKF